MYALIDNYGEIFQLRHPKGFCYAAIFGTQRDAALAMVELKLNARIISVRVK